MVPCDLECFEQCGNTGRVDLQDFREIDVDRSRRLRSENGQKAVAKLWRGIDAQMSAKADTSAFAPVVHRDFKAVGKSRFGVLHTFPRLVQGQAVCHTQNPLAATSASISSCVV